MKVTFTNGTWLYKGQAFEAAIFKNVTFGRGWFEGEPVAVKMRTTTLKKPILKGVCTDKLHADYDGFHSQKMQHVVGTFNEDTLVKSSRKVYVTQDGVWAMPSLTQEIAYELRKQKLI